MTTAPTPPRANALACEYRPSMPADVLHLWAKDAVAELIRLQAELEALKPLPPARVEEIMDDAGIADAVLRTAFAGGLRHGELVHGIKET